MERNAFGKVRATGDQALGEKQGFDDVFWHEHGDGDGARPVGHRLNEVGEMVSSALSCQCC